MVIDRGNRTEFNFFGPWAHHVDLIGDFGDGEVALPMVRREGSSYWRASLELRPGHYRFSYRADGQRFFDDASFARDDGPHSTRSLIRVPAGN